MITPLGERVLVRLLELEDKTPGGIVIPVIKVDEKIRSAKAMAVGKDCHEVKVDDIVLVNISNGTKIILDYEELFVFNESKILAVEE